MTLTDEQKKEMVLELTKKLFAEGKIIEGGFQSYQIVAMSPAAPPMQIRECRMAFFAGAQHLFASINSMISAGGLVTQAEMDSMNAIFIELQQFVEEIKKEKGFDS